MRNRTFFGVLFILISISSFSQKNTEQFSILFYNVENLFDTKNNPETEDDEYTHKGEKYWTNQKLNQKLQNISKVILSSAGWDLPALVALCEVENKYVLEKLKNDSPLRSKQYKIIHKESPDHRGTEVAVLYNPQQFVPITYNYFPLKDKNDAVIATREILYLSGIVGETDTLHIFVNHWPSRYSGMLETKADRMLAAQTLRQKVNALFELYSNPKIIIVGDFNDQPTNESIQQTLAAKKVENEIENKALYNLSYPWMSENSGTLKFQSQWSVFDQIIVSGYLLNSGSGYLAKAENASIISFPFLFEKDEKYGGQKPKRTYYGYQYLGGFSDHLPVLLQLQKK